MRTQTLNILIFSLWALTMMSGCAVFYSPVGDAIGTNTLDPALLDAVDQSVLKILDKYEYLNVAIVHNGDIVLTKSYGRNRLNRQDVYASVSKPVTAMILLQFVQQGMIGSLDDDIGDYHGKYKDAVPQEYGDARITFRHLLTHSSGVPHQTKLWRGGKLKLAFRPGEGVQYSTHGYGILGDVMEEISGLSYNRLVKEYIGKPIGANSLKVMHPFFDAPAGQVASTIEDMARFATAVMDGEYISLEMLYGEVLQPYTVDRQGSIGLGWYCRRTGTPQVAGYHAGSNGRPRAFLAIKPRMKNAVALTGRNRSQKGDHDFGGLTLELMGLIENVDSSQTVSANVSIEGTS